MSVFTDDELAFLQSKRIGRVATSNAKGDLHVVPLRFKYNAELDVVDLVGSDVGGTKKFRDVQATGRAAFVVDDVRTTGRAVSRSGGEQRLMPPAEAIWWRGSDLLSYGSYPRG